MNAFSRDKLRAALMKELEDLKNSYTAVAGASGRHLVMGLAANYTKKELYPFVVSLRDSGFTGDIVLFVTALDQETRDFFKQYNITAVRQWQNLFSYLNLQFARHVAYYDYLMNLHGNGIRYDRIFLTDVRDVLFQIDPFQAVSVDPITFFLESDVVTIGTCECNSNWIASGFGEKELSRLATKPISCSGTVVGSWRSIIEYLLWMLILSTLLHEDAAGVAGIDQGCHNMLVHSNLLAEQRIAANGDGVLTLHHVIGRETVYVSADGFVVDIAGNRFPVIHQYDRLHELTDHVLNKRLSLAA
jgi:hypothetical protein